MCLYVGVSMEERERGQGQGQGRRQGHVSRGTKITAKPRSHVLACHQPRGRLWLDVTKRHRLDDAILLIS